MLTLYVYVDGSDLADVEADLVSRFSAFIAEWGVETARLVNVKPPSASNAQAGDLADWNLGMNFTVDRLPPEKIRQLVGFLSRTARETRREFAIGSGGEDWHLVGPEPRENVVQLLIEQLA